MKTLIITDLSRAAELDSASMAAISGGTGYAPTLPKWDFPLHGKSGNIDFSAAQAMGQSQDTTVNNGNNVAFASGITAHVNPTQNGANTINFG